MNCASCGVEIEQHSGPGRPSVYCSDGCRRAAEFTIRRLLNRIDRAELEQREIKAGGWAGDDDERRTRLNALRRWLKADEAKLRALLGANNQIKSNVNETRKEKPWTT